MLAEELGLGDRAQSVYEGDAYRCFTVVNRSEEGKWVEVVRPYVHTQDFTYTAGVIPYLGWEQFKIDFNREVELIERERRKLR